MFLSWFSLKESIRLNYFVTREDHFSEIVLYAIILKKKKDLMVGRVILYCG